MLPYRRPSSQPHSPGLPVLVLMGLVFMCSAALALALSSSVDATGGKHGSDPSAQTPKSAYPVGKPAPARGDVPLPYDNGPQPQRVIPSRTGGPDAYGYIYSDNRDPGGPVYNWLPATQRVADSAWVLVRSTEPTPPYDDGVVTNTLPFVFNFYGTNYNILRTSTNGNVHFGAPNDYWPQHSNNCIPSNSQDVPQAMIAPLWFDFVVPLVGDPSPGGVYTDVVGTAPNRIYIIEWRNVYQFQNPNIRATFELLLYENGDMVFQYEDFNGSGVTGGLGVVGIQDINGAIALPYLCYQEDLGPERAIRYRVLQDVLLLPGNASAGGAPGSTIAYTETLRNQTGIDNSFTIVSEGRTWTTTVEPANTGIIPSRGTIPVTLRVEIPPDTQLGASDVATVTVSSNLPAPGTYTATAIFTTTASTLGVDFNPPGQTRAGAYGQPVTYTLDLTNRSGQNNTFDLGLSGVDWTTTITPSTTTNLAPDASQPVTVTVLVPADAVLGASDVVTVTATGQQPSPGQYTGLTVLTTTAGIWDRKANMPTGRSRAAAVAFRPNGHVYAIGGEFNNGSTDMPVSDYNPATDSWTDRVFLPTGVSNSGAAAIGNDIYIPGGYNSQSASVVNTLQVYHALDNTAGVITTDPLPAPRFGAGVAAYNGKLYVIGGADGTLAAQHTVYEYDPARAAGTRWQTRAPMPTARVYLGAGVVEGIIYAAGGVPGNFTDLATLEAYNPATDTWTARQPMSIGRGGLAVVGVSSDEPGCGGYLYAIGGGWSNYTASAERYDPTTDTWAPISSLSQARRTVAADYNPATFSLVAIGGWNGTYTSRTEAIACAGGLQPTPSPTSSCTVQFSDVPPDNTFYPFVRCLACRGIVSGYPDGTFLPNNLVTRGQLAKIVAESAGFADPVTGQTFEDVAPGSTFYDYIERLASRDVMGGYQCGISPGEPCGPGNRSYFRPNANSTRGQLTKIVSNAAGFNDILPPAQYQFTDVPPGATFWLYVERLLLNRPGVMNGYPCGAPGEPCDSENRPYFRPGNNVTRGQTSKIVANTFFPNCQTPQR